MNAINTYNLDKILTTQDLKQRDTLLVNLFCSLTEELGFMVERPLRERISVAITDKFLSYLIIRDLSHILTVTNNQLGQIYHTAKVKDPLTTENIGKLRALYLSGRFNRQTLDFFYCEYTLSLLGNRKCLYAIHLVDIIPSAFGAHDVDLYMRLNFFFEFKETHLALEILMNQYLGKSNTNQFLKNLATMNDPSYFYRGLDFVQNKYSKAEQDEILKDIIYPVTKNVKLA